MKPIFTPLLFVLSIVACTKKDSLLTGTTNPDVLTPVTSNTPPAAYAGTDQVVFLPANECKLVGSYSGTGIQSVLWRKISGPSSFSIENPDLLTTKVQNLQKGIYIFELTVTNSSMLNGKDTVTVEVAEATSGHNEVIGNNEVIFKHLTWIFPWYASVEIKNFWAHVPEGKPMKVFIQRSYETTWTEVPPISSNSSNNISYEYFIETRPDGAGMYNYGSLYVFFYGDNTNDNPNIKVIF